MTKVQNYIISENYNNSKENYRSEQHKLSIEIDGQAQIVAANTDTQVIAATANRKFHMTGLVVHNDNAAAALITLYDGAGGIEKFHIYCGANAYASTSGRHITFTTNTAVIAQSTVGAAAPNDVRIFIDGYWEYV